MVLTMGRYSHCALDLHITHSLSLFQNMIFLRQTNLS